MPGRNGMGPMGQGPMTGGGRGWCDGAAPGVDMAARGPVMGMGRGNGRGGGFRHRHGYDATGLTGWQRTQMGWPGPNARPAAATEQELAVLKQQVTNLEQALGALNSRIQQLDKLVPEAPKTEHL